MRIPGLFVLVLLLGCPGASIFAGEDCPSFQKGIATGQPEPRELIEISGMAASRINPGALWVHNDSSSAFRLYALNPAGQELGCYTVTGIPRGDWEDMAIGPGPEAGRDYIYIGNIGDNKQYGKTKVLYRFPEPKLPDAAASFSQTVDANEQFILRFPEDHAGPFDCEALMADPVNGDIYFITKDSGLKNDGNSEVFRVANPRVGDAELNLEHVLTLDLNPGVMNLVTSADIAPGGGAILVRTYLEILYWTRPSGSSVAEALAKPPCHVPQVPEPQGEAIAFDAGGTGYYTASESRGAKEIPPIHYFARDTAKAGP